MKRQLTILSAGLLMAGFALAFKLKHYDHNPNTAGRGFALVELYTSEGCSSCPAADKLVAEIAQEYKNKQVYVLAYHVDYWNRLGWKDVYSSPKYSARQSEYARYLKLDGVYTPQAIVNGKVELIGSDNGKLHSAIQQALAKPAAVELDLSNVKISGSNATLNYKVNSPANNSLMLAVIKKHAETLVKAGENSGRALSHINIVQELSTIDLKTNDGSAKLALPLGFNNSDWEIVGFVQNKSDGDVLAIKNATSVKVVGMFIKL